MCFNKNYPLRTDLVCILSLYIEKSCKRMKYSNQPITKKEIIFAIGFKKSNPQTGRKRTEVNLETMSTKNDFFIIVKDLLLHINNLAERFFT